MSQTIPVVSDGEVFRPTAPVNLPPGGEYHVTVDDSDAQPEAEVMPEIFRLILDRARDLGVGDLAEQHDHYLYGTPKR